MTPLPTLPRLAASPELGHSVVVCSPQEGAQPPEMKVGLACSRDLAPALPLRMVQASGVYPDHPAGRCPLVCCCFRSSSFPPCGVVTRLLG